MAEKIISTVAERIIRSLASEAVKEFSKMLGIEENEFLQLEATISTIKAVLVDAEKQQIHNHQIKDWLNKLEDVVYDADDFVGYFCTRALQRQDMIGSNYYNNNNNNMVKLKRQVRSFLSCPNQLVFGFKMVHKLKEIRYQLAEISLQRSIFDLKLEERNDETLVVTRPRHMTHYPYVRQEEVIGREFDREAILKLLLLDQEIEGDDDDDDDDDDMCVHVLAIVGLGGSGKTTLAQLVYHDEEVQTHFDLKMWVCVSHDFDARLIVEKIIKSADNKSTENLEIEQLHKELQKLINGKRYLLVLDDVWNENDELWVDFKSLLSNGAQGSRIVITTRSNVVAKITSTMKPYMLGMLDGYASWSLFKRFAFNQGQNPYNNSNILEIGKQIVNKYCGGNPLAIRTIGSMLYFIDSETEWQSFLNMEFSKTPQQEHDILQVLKLSFDYLPSPLKHCFAYCCIFPKEYEIDVQTLINLWMAQGFIYTSHDMGNAGYNYFRELLWRSFFQDIQKDKHGMPTKCKMHSLIHDLAILVAGTRYKMLLQNEKNIDRNVHHLSFNFHLDSYWQIPASLVQAKRIRTILLSNQLQWETEGRSSGSICGNMVLGCRRLRVLDLHNSGINIVPSSIGKLKLLRYLDLSRNMNIKKLPSSVTKLYNLQTLKLNFCQRLQELPRDMKKLINLINLEIDGCYSLTHMPCGLGQLTNMRTLSEFVIRKKADLDLRHKVGGLDELKNLDNLRGELRIKNLRHGAEYEVANLEKKTQLVSLILIWNNNDLEAMKAVADRNIGQCSNQEMNVESSYLRSLNGLKPHTGLKELSLSAYGGVLFPDWFSSLTSLVRVSLWGCEKCQYIPLLHQFSSLVVLILAKLTNLEYILVDDEKNQLPSTPEFLPSLKELRLTDLPNLKQWWRSSGENEGVDATSSSTKATSLSTAESYQPLFPCLSKLIIENCPKLDSMPLYPYLDEVLQLNNSSWKPFQQTMSMRVAGQQIPTTTASSSSSSFSFSSSSFSFSSSSLSSSSLRCTSTFSPLSKLRNLCIVGMMELDISNGDVIMWEAFQSLQSLTFDHLPQLKTLPEGLQQVNSLQELHIRHCNNLEAIPDWITKLKSLKKLALRLLPNLASLPVELYGLASLRLKIEDCPKIAQKANNPVKDLIMKFLRNSEPPRIMQW